MKAGRCQTLNMASAARDTPANHIEDWIACGAISLGPAHRR
jgi:hypothetical protein